ncbi:cytochrome p450 domain-containing protein [Hirsutella rhossiliensis]|uniref:Cytochrome p450 domain-containing protein n=1 Tax=Hirsutella rhossiliensis TaxID=111463 RepID=A0A9P8SLY9_9HYPO|nr:cytochrome p450 domain-containing protein [Hirsutella rhossiliensis]KAH0966784.1 cytochrome p450 domain-containing protein [Hirsutella rhossiliensis]
MIRYKADVYKRLRDKYGLPIYTLRMPGARIYVVNSTALIPVVQRQFRTVAFTPFAARAFKFAMGGSKTANDIIAVDMTEDHGYLMSFDKAIHPAVTPGPALDAMNLASIQNVAASLDELRRQGPSTISMFKWIQHAVLLSTTDAVYGPQNPYKDPAMEAAWHVYEPRITTFMLNLLPAISAKKSLKAREFMVQKFEAYFRDGGQTQASALVQRRYEHNAQHHIPLNDIARTEIGGSFALLSNTIPATFWLLWQILSDPVVFRDCQQELAKGVQESDDVCTIDVDYIKTDCPIFLSTFQEVFRFHGINNSVRMVLEDCMLDGQYLLKKGSTVMMPGPVQHSIPSIWGPDVAEFNHKRFVRSPNSKRPNPIAFRGFGGV